MAVVSTYLYTVRDEAGNPRTEAWFTLEMTGAYQGDGGYAGGQAFDLSPYLRRIEHIQAMPVSGCSLRDIVSGPGNSIFRSGERVLPTPVLEDYGTPASARFQLIGRPTPFLSGPAGASGYGLVQLASGLAAAISGIRFVARVLGY